MSRHYDDAESSIVDSRLFAIFTSNREGAKNTGRQLKLLLLLRAYARATAQCRRVMPEDICAAC